MYENVLLYFFSTVPQVLGALIGLIAIFYGFNNERIKREIANNVDNFDNDYHHINSGFDLERDNKPKDFSFKITEFNDLCISESYDDLFKNIMNLKMATEDGVIKVTDRYINHLNKILRSLSKYYYQKTTVRRMFLINIVIIGIFILSFNFIHWIKDSTVLTEIAMSVGTIIASIGLYFIGTFIIDGINNKVE